MSGGSYDYVFSRFSDAADTLRGRHPNESHVLALAAHLDALSDVMHSIEWADSCDTSWTPELDARIRGVLLPGEEIGVAIKRAEAVQASLKELLSRLPSSDLTEERT